MAEQFEIVRAQRKQARLRLAVAAASGGGKTRGGLELAFGIVEQLIARGLVTPRPQLASPLEGLVGVIDTERRSAQLESHVGPFDTIELGPPHTVDRYIGALQALERAGCVAVLLDSISHAWVGDGGVLSILDRFQAGERFSAFGSAVNPVQDKFVDALLRSPCHIIATMRSKTAWVLEDKENRQGRMVKTPRRIGLAPVQRPGIEYEFTALLNIDTDTHFASVVKARGTVFDGWEPHKITREDGRRLADWLLEGEPEQVVVSGTPLERLRAVGDAGIRTMARCGNLPDLAREFENAQRQVRSFKALVGAVLVDPVMAEVVAAKDARKAELSGGALAPAGAAAPSRRGGAFDGMEDDIPWGDQA